MSVNARGQRSRWREQVFRLLKQLAHGCLAEVAPLQGPLIGDFQRQGSHQSDHRRLVREDLHHLGAALDFAVQALQWIG